MATLSKKYPFEFSELPLDKINGTEKVLSSQEYKTVNITVDTVKDYVMTAANTAFLPKGTYLTEHQDISGKQDKLSDKQLANINADHSNYLTSDALTGIATESWVEGKEYLTSYTETYQGTVKSVNGETPDTNGNVTLTIPSTDGFAKVEDIKVKGIKSNGSSVTLTPDTDGIVTLPVDAVGEENIITSIKMEGATDPLTITNKEVTIPTTTPVTTDSLGLASVATSGSYNDLKDTPTNIVSSTTITKIEKVTELPSDAADHMDTLYIIVTPATV